MTADGRSQRRLFVKRVCIAGSVISLWTLAALTASLPINLPSKQYSQSYEYLDPSMQTLDHGDTAWMIIATILGLIASPLLAYFHGNNT